MDAGDRWMLQRCGGQTHGAWDNLGRRFRTDYDALQRPAGSFVKGADRANANRISPIRQGDLWRYAWAMAYLAILKASKRSRPENLRGKPYRHHDTPAGLVTSLGRNPATDARGSLRFQGQSAAQYATTDREVSGNA